MNILLTSVGRRGYMLDYFREALQGKGKVHAANSQKTSALRHADKHTISPPINSPEYVSFLLEYCKKHDITALLSLFDIDLQVLSNHREHFLSHGIQTLVSKPETVKICNDKWLTARFLDSLHVARPLAWVSLEECKRDIAAGKAQFPIVLKPRFGMGSIGLYEAENQQELEIFYSKILRTISNTYVGLANFGGEMEEVLIQEKVVGSEYGLDIFNDLTGNYAATAARKKLAMRNGETDRAITVENTPFLELAQKISKALKHIGNLDVDLLLTHEGKMIVLEMNARFGGGYPFSHVAGANFPAQLVKWLNDKGTDESLLSYKSGILLDKEIFPAEI